MGLENIVVFGNGAVDARLNGGIIHTIDDDKVTIESNGSKLEIEVIDGPIKARGKYTAKKQFSEKLLQFSPEIDFGGGGYNSLMEILRLRERNNGAFKLCYVDMSTPSLDSITPTQSIKKVLHDMGVDESLFFDKRPLPLNLVLDDRINKVIIKSPMDYQGTRYTDDDVERVRDVLRGSKCILANSLKDAVFANLISEYSSNGRMLINVVTNSLDYSLVYDTLVPKGITIFNYDELGAFMKGLGKDCFGTDADENKKIEYAVKAIQMMRDDGRSKPIYVTLGRNGALCAYNGSNGRIHHVSHDSVSKKVQEAIDKQKKTICGAGDCFAGGVFYYYMTTNNPDVNTAGMEGCMRSVKYLGYPDRISYDDFTISRDLNISPVSGIKKAA